MTREQILVAIRERRRRGFPLTGVWQEDRELYEAAHRLFGGWNQAVAATQLFRNPRKRWTKELILDGIKYWHASGVRVREIRRHDLKLLQSAQAHFKNWSNAVEAAGIAVVRKERWTKERVISELRKGYRLGPILVSFVSQQLRDYAAQLFGTLDAALEAAGLEPEPRRWPPRRIISTIQDHYTRGLSLDRPGCGNHTLTVAARRVFGTWQGAVEAAGLGNRLTGKPLRRHWSQEAVIAAIRVHLNNGVGISRVWKKDPTLYSAAKSCFGTWLKALAAMGIKSSIRRWSRELIVQEILRRQRDGKTLSSLQISKEDSGLVAAALNHFGSWTSALAAAGLKPLHRTFSRESVAQALRQRHQEGRACTAGVLSQEDGGLANAVYHHFGTWQEGLVAAGIKTSQPTQRPIPAPGPAKVTRKGIRRSSADVEQSRTAP